MCGIVGYLGRQPAAPILFEGLQRLEYRGYDSAGIAVVGTSALRVHKAAGRVGEVAARAPKRLGGKVGIGHTRWATHGEPTDANAHPHVDASGRIAVVHNGIIENASELKATVLAGVAFASETDTEVLAHLIAAQDHDELEDRVRAALLLVEGAYGIAVVDQDQPDRIVVARNGSPVLLAVGEHEMFVASDAAAVIRHTDQVVHLDDRELAVVRAGGYRTFTLDAVPTTKAPTRTPIVATAYDKGGHRDHMHKEIHEQPVAVERALGGRLDRRFATAHLGGLRMDPREVLALRRVKVLGCGSAFYAGLAGALQIETLARIPADAEAASEFRYRNPIIEPDTLYVAVSQSGETFDTLAAVQEIKRKGGTVIGVVNTPGSTIARECGAGIFLHAGPEVSVTSTKTFTSTGVAFALLALQLGRTRDLGPADGGRIIAALDALPAQIQQVLDAEAEVAAVAERLAGAESAFFIGRVRGHHVALEAAQKLKEISYVHAEAYPGAELKHGPLALVSPAVPTVAVVPDDELWEKNLSTIAEIRARKGPVIVVTDSSAPVDGADAVLRVPRTAPELAPLLLGIPLQLLAYHCALQLGRDIDQPRNLAKSVTVE
ncbi:glutamine--fructose-6-phosphate transaminase (isomerizing) [Aquihabitans sp. G128]|uniref:glutamine--fructose-6-phosphate transaminase (isomerizing) n=1 Tax=Aquihabitans sp. G128 TaxID=2849779 RepID=UPI001C219228|nr:glutamine--fructose-6-phosphate transaminase (isomerizing) [Aquihabitans sp. G128]QXC62532.1 glutamine--fructose-6-phosphate transaminase (isomerizing) [Aquihabitans sp. G128]